MCAVQEAQTSTGSLEVGDPANVSIVAVCPERRADKPSSSSEEYSLVLVPIAEEQLQLVEDVTAAANVSEARQPETSSASAEHGHMLNMISYDGMRPDSRCDNCDLNGNVSERRAVVPPEPATDVITNATGVKMLTASRGVAFSAQRTKWASAVLLDDGMDVQDATERASTLSTSISQAMKPDISVLASAVAASKLGLVDQLSQALATCSAVAFAKDAEDRTCLHYAAGYGHEECVSLLLEHKSDTRVRDANGDLPLHFAAIHGHPMCAYNITKACPSTCLTRNYRGQTPVEVAVACERGEVLNAMLLACAGDGSAGVTVQAMRKLLTSGAVPDTWAPNGSSALMLAAAANGTEALAVLLEAGATLELQDALGRSALMFAAGNCARDTLMALLDAGACISQRDRRGRNVLDYAPSGSEVRRLLQARLDELEAVATKLQQDLLDSLQGPAGADAAAGVGSGSDSKPANGAGKKKKQSAAAKKAAAAAPSASASSSQGKAAAFNSASITTAKRAPAVAAAAPEAATSASPSTVTKSASCPAVKASGGGKAASITVVATATVAAGPREALAPYSGPSGAQCDSDGDSSAWQTVSSHKCSGKQRQQQQNHVELQEAVGSRAGAASASSSFSSVASAAPGLHGSAVAAGIGPNSRPSAARPVAAPTPSTSKQGPAVRGVKGSSSATAVAVPASASSVAIVAGGLGTASNGSQDAAAVAGRGMGSASQLAAPPLSKKGTTADVGGTVPAPASGFKAALLGLGLDPTGSAPLQPQQATSTAAASKTRPEALVISAAAAAAGTASAAAVAVHLGLPPIATSSSAPRSVPGGSSGPINTAPQERKTAWGGVKLGLPVAVAASGAVAMHGCSPRSYPPLSAATGPAVTATALPTAQQQASRPSQRNAQQVAPPRHLTVTANKSSSCTDASSSAAAVSAPPSIVSVAESDVLSTGASTCSQPGVNGASSPRSLSHDWTRPSPVDVLLQAALASSGCDPHCTSSACSTDGSAAATRRPGHSKTSSAGSSSFLSSLDGFTFTTSGTVCGCGSSSGTGMAVPFQRDPPFAGPSRAAAAGSVGTGGSSTSALTPPPPRPSPHAPPPGRQPSQQPAHHLTLGGLSLSLLGGTEVPAPQRRSAGGAGASQEPPALPPLVVELPAPTAPLPRSLNPAAALPDNLDLNSPPARRVAVCTDAPTGGGGATSGTGALGIGGRGSDKGAPHGDAGNSRGGGGGGGGAARAGRAGAGAAGAASSEVTRLKAEVDALQRQLRQAAQRHSQEIAAVLLDAEQQEERAIAQERLRITANLLAIGLCPEAILAVITPPGHGLNIAQILTASATTAFAATTTTGFAAVAITAPNTSTTSSSSCTAAALIPHDACTTAHPAAPSSSAVVPVPSLPTSLPGSESPMGVGTVDIAATAPAVRFSTAANRRGCGSDRSVSGSRCHSNADLADPSSSSTTTTAAAAASVLVLPRWLETSCNTVCATATGDDTSRSAGRSQRPTGSSAAIAIPSSSSGASAASAADRSCLVSSSSYTHGGGFAADASGARCREDLAGTQYPFCSGQSSCFTSWGSPSSRLLGLPCGAASGADGSRFPGRLGSSLGSGAIVGSGLCGGLGLGALSALDGSVCGGPGSRLGLLAPAAAGAGAESGDGQDDGELDLPACGDISALLAMSDDDDA